MPSAGGGRDAAELTVGTTFHVYAGAALAEIGGCFAFWTWLRLHRSPFWLAPGRPLLLFALLLTRVETEVAGRACAGYDGVSIAASLLWLWLIEGRQPDRWTRQAPLSA